jgi:transposase, IS6 family
LFTCLIRHCCIGGRWVRWSGWWDELSSSSPRIAGPQFGVQGLPVPARHHRRGSALVPVYSLSFRDLEELLAERGVEVDHVTVFRWLQRFTPLLADAVRPCRRAVGDRWFVDETYVKVAGVWRYVYRAVDQHGQIIDVYVSTRRDTAAARRFFDTALGAHPEPVEVVTDRAPALRAVIEELIPAAFHNVEQYPNSRI